MKILTVEKNIVDLTTIDDIVPNTQFTVIDIGSDVNHHGEADVVFPKLLYVEDYSGPALECDVDGHRVMLPLAWNIFIGDEEVSEVEIVPITSLNARSFSVIVTNPIDGFRHYFKEIRICGVYTEYDWVLPKIKNGQALAVPINDDSNKPLCVFISHSTAKIPNTLSPMDFM